MREFGAKKKKNGSRHWGPPGRYEDAPTRGPGENPKSSGGKASLSRVSWSVGSGRRKYLKRHMVASAQNW